MANIIFTSIKESISKAEINLSAVDIGVALTYGYSPSINDDIYLSSIESYELSEESYERKQLENVSLTKDTVNNRMTLDADNLEWELANFTADGAVIYVDNGDDNLNNLIAYLDFGVDSTSQNTPFIIEWSVEGILQIK
jgi:hypothetical protein